MTNTHECGACGSKGWRYILRIDDAKFDVVRCTMCKKYASDEEAVEAWKAFRRAGWPDKSDLDLFNSFAAAVKVPVNFLLGDKPFTREEFEEMRSQIVKSTWSPPITDVVTGRIISDENQRVWEEYMAKQDEFRDRGRECDQPKGDKK